MCDITRRSVCHGDRQRQWNPVKLSKWELPIPSTTYWEDICQEIEKKYKKVRDPYPSSLSYPFPKPSSRSTSSPRSDDIKFKISPPTPRHHAQKSTFAFKDNKNNLSDKSIGKEGNECKVVDKNLKLPPVFQKKGRTEITNDENVAKKSTKIYSKDFCPQHKNASVVKIFDDEISKYLKKRISSVPKLPQVTKVKPILPKEGKSFRSSSASSLQSKASKASLQSKASKVSLQSKASKASLQSKTSKTSTLQSKASKAEVQQSKTSKTSILQSKASRAEIQQSKKIVKAPKLGMASLLPSFAKAISIDSCDTRESIESDDAIYEVQSRAENETEVSKRDFLRVPNFSFVSSHPSFRNLSIADSYSDTDESQEIAIVSEGDFLQAEKYLKPDAVSDSLVEDTHLTSDHQSSNVDETKEVETAEEKDESIEIVADLETRYAYKALDMLRKRKHKLEDKVRDDISDINISDHNVGSATIRKKEHSLKSLNSDELESVTIRTSSRSTSGLSADFKNKTIKIAASGNDILETLPKTVVYQRPNIDRCLACMPKPLSRSAKVYRELPITTLKYIVENPTDFRASSSSSSCSSSSLSIENSNYSISARDIDTVNILLPEDQLSEISVQTQKEVTQSKDQIKVSFDERNLYPTSKASSETLSPANKSTSSKEQLILDRSFSIQSSERSKTSSPSLQSSDSDEPGFQDDKLPSSKSTAPCHAPVVWRKSLEPLRALRHKKFVSLRARAATVTAKSSDDSGSDSDQDAGPLKKQDEEKTKSLGEDSQSKKEKKKKPLLRMKTVAEQLTLFSSSQEEKAKKKLKRSKSTFDLITIPDDSESTESKEDADSEDVKQEEKEEPLPYFEAILLHRAGSPPPPIMSTQEVAEIIKQFSAENCNASDLLNQLGNEFLRKLKERLKLYENNDNKMYIELGINLFQSLLDSRRYLKSDTFDPNLEFSHKQPPLSNSRQLRRILPPKSFELIAPILGMPLTSTKKRKTSKPRTRIECSTEAQASEAPSGTWIKWDKIVHPPSSRKSDKHVAYYAAKNPYASFLTKPRRKVVVWRPLREEDMKGYDPEATLEMRATRLMNKICKNFCDWLKQLGGTEQVIDEETLKDMFEINFTAEACKAMQVVLKEMPTIPGAVAKARNCPEAGELEATRHELKKDVKLESRSKRLHAFGRSLPNDLRFVPPSGHVSTKWVECKNIPRDLEAMDVVWHDILNKDIISAFIDYLKENPQAAPLQLQKSLEQKRDEYFKMLQAGDDSDYILVDDDNDNLHLIPSETASGI